MKIEIEEIEIKEAILDFVVKKGFTIGDEVPNIDIKNARGNFGITATVDMDAGPGNSGGSPHGSPAPAAPDASDNNSVFADE